MFLRVYKHIIMLLCYQHSKQTYIPTGRNGKEREGFPLPKEQKLFEKASSLDIPAVVTV